MGWFKKRRRKQIEFDEVFIDAFNLPLFNTKRMEGRVEAPLTSRNIYIIGVIFLLIVMLFCWYLFKLQVIEGSEMLKLSEINKLDNAIIFAKRGVIYDRHQKPLAWNETDYSGKHNFPVRAYADDTGLGQIIGYVNYPKRDANGFYFRTEYTGLTGVEAVYDDRLKGINGKQLVEIDALGAVISDYAINDSEPGKNITLSLDAELSKAIYDLLATTTLRVGFKSGVGVIMNVNTGEIIASASFPDYDPEIMSDGGDIETIDTLNNDERSPFLNKAIGGLYTPGSIIKPFIAYAALKEGVINPHKTIVSDGRLVVPNPHQPDEPSVFTDWRAHGEVDMRQAIAVSSNVYFYVIGGGFEDQVGLGIDKLSKYARRFGFGRPIGLAFQGEVAGTVPDQAWKKQVFDDAWRLGDTYITAIGQFGFQVTPLQVVRAYGALANGGKLLTPQFEKGVTGDYTDLELDEAKLDVIQSGLRLAVTDNLGTARRLNREDVEVAAKSGTAELGTNNRTVNTWIAGYWPYQEPRYSFALLMENGPYENTFGAVRIMNSVVERLK